MKRVYAAIPRRMANIVPLIKAEIIKEGNFPIIPLELFRDFDYNNGNTVMRKQTERQIEITCGGLVYVADKLNIYGIGDGSLKDFSHARIIGKPVNSLITSYDSEWRYKAARPEYGQFKLILEDILGKEVMKRLIKEAKSHYPPVNEQSPRWPTPDDGHKSITHH